MFDVHLIDELVTSQKLLLIRFVCTPVLKSANPIIFISKNISGIIFNETLNLNLSCVPHPENVKMKKIGKNKLQPTETYFITRGTYTQRCSEPNFKNELSMESYLCFCNPVYMSIKTTVLIL